MSEQPPSEAPDQTEASPEPPSSARHPPEIPEDRLDPDALKVVYRLRHTKHQAYFVGGCVRDLLLGKTPKDFDIATSAHPGEVRAAFRNCRLIGRRFRLAHVYFRGGKIIEVATFRANPTDQLELDAEADREEAEGEAGEVELAAHEAEQEPKEAFAGRDLLITRDNVFGTAEEDARRRDFSINGLFYDVFAGEVIDYVGGLPDLEARRLATIGDPEVRMREDPVRALRAVRFAARLDLAIEPETFAAMKRHAGELARCAPPRVLEEIFKILRCGNSARAFELMRACGALPVVLPTLGGWLEGADEAAKKRFFAYLKALDELVRSGPEVSEAVLLGALLIHLRSAAQNAAEPIVAPPEETQARPEVEGEDEDEEAETPSERRARQEDPADAFLEQMVRTARLPRRIAERTRLALLAQRHIGAPPQKRRRRRRRGLGIGNAQNVQDALQLFELTVRATGEGQEALQRFRERVAARPPPPAPERRPRYAHGAPPSAGQPGERAAHHAEAAAQPAVEPGAQPDAPREGGGAPPAAPVQLGPDGLPIRKKRRRRGGRRRRRRGQGGGGGPGGATPPPAP